MVKFSDLKGGPEKSSNQPRQTIRARPSKGSRLSFSQLDKGRAGFASERGALEKAARVEDRHLLYDRASAYLDEIFSAIRKRQRFSLEAGIQIVGEMVDGQTDNDPLFLRAIHLDDPRRFLINNCINVAIFSVKIAKYLQFSPNRQNEIGLVALLHETGMGVIPEKLIFKKEKLTRQEFEIFAKRTEYAYKILRVFSERYPFLAETAIQIHERIDGSGYPSGLRGDEISEYAQIIGLADIYEALIHSRPQREKLLYFSAIKEIIRTCKGRFQNKYLKALLNSVSIFPLGSYVRVNSNAIGKVFEIHPEHPLRPKLQIVFDSQGHKVMAERILDLKENSILFIVDSVSETIVEELSKGVTEAQRSYEFTDKEIEPLPHFDEKLAIGAQQEGGASAEDTLPDFVEEVDQPFSLGDAPEKTEVEPMGREKKFRIRIRKPGWIKYVLILAAVLGILLGLLWYYGSIKKEPTVKGGLKQSSAGKGSQVPGSGLQGISKKTIRKTGNNSSSKTDTKGPAGSRRNTAPAGMRPNRRGPTAEKASQIGSRVSARQKDILQKPKKSKPVINVPGPSFPYSINLASFRSLKLAQNSLSKFKAEGLSPYWVKVNLGDQGIWYRLFAGHFKTARQAENRIAEKNLVGATAKKTRYATLIGSYTSKDELNQESNSVLKSGFFPYTIKDEAGRYHLYVGAFYTRKGAKDQQLELKASGIESKIVER